MATKGAAQKAQEEGGEIDLTPMLDVVFIMLIFFIVTAVFIKEPGVTVERPDTVIRDAVKNQSVLVAINEKNEIWIDRKKIDERAVKATIERIAADNPLGALVIQADGASNAGTYALVWDAAKAAGVADIAIATDEK
ncbi:MAG: biopolymer transporter ExbD [Gammaproteobacteria bacterium]|nr:biopolymer transporter ExbD [Gammaproteobacteria bacterium]MBT8151656.1 biopolymer transporter ExbD [Gammaproteobacteria bacterium]NND40292.1 biopolymer transporter ExbD [Pseudomonadales bacterium]NNL10432.1 biopolymer transporter ExbD [Pseudomonadales bacterium]NNM10331.1 biopolymer transporter ExbD [Pseudomonadales bacterium]